MIFLELGDALLGYGTNHPTHRMGPRHTVFIGKTLKQNTANIVRVVHTRVMLGIVCLLLILSSIITYKQKICQYPILTSAQTFDFNEYKMHSQSPNQSTFILP